MSRSIAWAFVWLVVGAGAPLEAFDRPSSPHQKATFAGGCFWCVEQVFDEVPGVVSTRSGYTGGRTANPTYEQVSAGGTGHAEAVEVIFDPDRVSYEKLLTIFWHNIDPTTPDRQFCDHGDSYRAVIFTRGGGQYQAAMASKRALDRNKPFPQPIVTEIVPATTFYPAEEYHQDYHHKNPIRYTFYKWNCGRQQRLEELWGDAAGH
ncbi:MAG: peptide-methionine (S)-S-oxide reductase MsrA [Gemmatimonadota bacterium]